MENTTTDLTDDLFHVMGHLQAAGINTRESRRLIAKVDTERSNVSRRRYDRGDWVQIRYATDKTRLALILDRSDLSVGNYRGSVIAGARACAERTILATEIIGPAPENKRLRDAKALMKPGREMKPSYRVGSKLYTLGKWLGTPASSHPIGVKIERLVYARAEYDRLQVKPSIGSLYNSPLGLFDITTLDEHGLWGEQQATGYKLP